MAQQHSSGAVVILGVTLGVGALLVYLLSRNRPVKDDTFKRRPYSADPWLKKVGYFGKWWRYFSKRWPLRSNNRWRGP